MVPDLLFRGHYSDIAKVTNVWRSPGTADKIRKAFCQLHGEKRAKASVWRLPPRALRGRWGSMTAVEIFLLASGPDFLPEAFAAAACFGNLVLVDCLGVFFSEWE